MSPMKRILSAIIFLTTSVAHAGNVTSQERWDQLEHNLSACSPATPIQPLMQRLRALRDSEAMRSPQNTLTLHPVKAGVWRLIAFERGSGRWAEWGMRAYFLDLRQCTGIAMETHGVFSDASYAAKVHTFGKPSASLRGHMMAWLKLEVGKPGNPKHALGHFVTRQNHTAQLTHEGTTYDVRTSKSARAWHPGPPTAQLKTLWPTAAKAQKIVVGVEKLKRWKRLGRHDLYRYDGGMRFRRGREALALYDRKTRRHAWVLATPLTDTEGKVSVLGVHGPILWVSVGTRLLAIQTECAATFEVRPTKGSDAQETYEALRSSAPLSCPSK